MVRFSHVELALDLTCQPELLALFDALNNVMFCLKDEQHRYLAVNDAFVRRTPCNSKREVLGRTAAEIFPDPLARRYDEQDDEVLSTGQPLRDELELIRCQDGSLGWYLTTKLPVTCAGEQGPIRGLASISQDLRTPSQDDIAVQSLTRVVEYVRVNLEHSIRVGDLAQVAGCSPSQLERRLRAVFGLTATQYVMRVRVERASALLTTTDLPLAEIASATGFYDQSEFTKRFARLTTETPATFRARSRAAQALRTE